MTYPDRRLEGPIEPPVAGTENTQDIVPPSERGQDPERSTHELVTEGSRPLSDEERKSADRDTPVSERVYAPASERVPKTVEGHRDVIEHPDNSTPERQAVSQTSATQWSPQSTDSSSAWSQQSTGTEPSFTRVPRPSGNGSPQNDYQTDWSNQTNRWMSNASGGTMLPFGIGWLSLAVCGGVGVWLWMRWQRERNKPINRIRRQARDTASQAFATASQARARASAIYDDIPDEAVRPAMGLGTALLSLAVVLWQQSQSRSRADEARSRARGASHRATKAGRRAADSLSDLDWQQRLMALRELWNPGRLELEKVSLPKR
jgi:hypothetical protein